MDLTFTSPAPLPTTSTVAPVPPPAATPTPEAPKENILPPVPEQTHEERVKASQFAALAKKERMVQKSVMAQRAREQEIAAREAKLKEKEDAFSEMNPIKALEKLGYSYDQITQIMLDEQKANAPEFQVKRLQSEMDRRFQEQAKQDQERQAQEKARIQADYDATITAFKADVKGFVKENTEKFELTNLLNQDDLVIATIERYFELEKKVLPTEQAAEHVENYLRDQINKIEGTKWWKSRNAAPAVPGDAGDVVPQKPKAPAPSLSNIQQSAAPTLLGPRTERDRMQRALAALAAKGS